MTTKTETQYHKMEVYKEDYPGCCGIDVFTGLDLNEVHYGDDGYTKEEVFNKLLKQISKERECRHVQMSFVTKYKDRALSSKMKGQCDGLKEFLLDKGWYIVDEFVAPRHGNTVCVMAKTWRTKKIPERKYNAAMWW